MLEEWKKKCVNWMVDYIAKLWWTIDCPFSAGFFSVCIYLSSIFSCVIAIEVLASNRNFNQHSNLEDCVFLNEKRSLDQVQKLLFAFKITNWNGFDSKLSCMQSCAMVIWMAQSRYRLCDRDKKCDNRIFALSHSFLHFSSSFATAKLLLIEIQKIPVGVIR